MIFPPNYLVVLTNWDSSLLSIEVLGYKILKKNISSKPFLHGKAFFTDDPGGLRPYKFVKMKTRMSQFWKAEEFTQLLVGAKYILVPLNSSLWRKQDFLSYLRAFKINPYKIAPLCYDCLQKYQRLTLLQEKEVIRGFDGRILCSDCAMEIIKSHISNLGFHQTQSLIDYARKKLLQTRTLKDALETLEPVSPTHEESFSKSHTLYDIIEAAPVKPKPLNETPLSPELKKLFIRKGISELLPIQLEALNAGLLDGEDLLVIAGTSSGKTLIGEIAGLYNLLSGKGKMLFLTPLVALTNQKYDYFLRRYSPSGLKVGIRVGMTRLDLGDEDRIMPDTRIEDRDIIVGTIEAIDFLLRSKRANELGDVATVVIDEFQLLGDEERGIELDGTLVRLRHLFPTVQIIALSATIGNSKEIANHYGLRLVENHDRPVALERHVILTQPGESKIPIISKLIRNELRRTKKMKFKGQTIVFSPTRRGCEELASKLGRDNIKATYYHSGLPYVKRRRIEKGFEEGIYDAIVTTAALGAGVDFSSSQVIFECPAMGARWLRVAEFHQMMGRAGRYGKHEIGKVYLLLEPGAKLYAKMDETEDQVGLKLLTAPIEAIEGNITFEAEQDQLLAMISSTQLVPARTLRKLHQSMYYQTNRTKDLVKPLLEIKLINAKGKGFEATSLGIATSTSFIYPTVVHRTVQQLKGMDVLDIVARLEPFENLHLASRIQSRIERIVKARGSTKFFSNRVLDLLSGDFTLYRKEDMDPYVLDRLRLWIDLLYPCSHQERPFCDCGQISIAKLIIQRRIQGDTPSKVISFLESNYDLTAYTGDLVTFLDAVVHRFEALYRISTVLGMESQAKVAKEYAELVKSPSKKKQRSKKSTRKKRAKAKRHVH